MAHADAGGARARQALAVAKTSQPCHEVFVKAIGANWLVNVAIFQASSAATFPLRSVIQSSRSSMFRMQQQSYTRRL